MIPVIMTLSDALAMSTGEGYVDILESDQVTYFRDATTCLVTEEKNGEFSLKMTYKISHENASIMKEGIIVLAKPNETDRIQPFRIYRITEDIKGTATAYGEHISSMLNEIPVINSGELTNVSASDVMNSLKNDALIDCPFTFTSDAGTATSYSTNVGIPTAFKQFLQGMTGSILQIFNGEYKYDWFNVNLMEHRGKTVPEVTILYGKNITGMKKDGNISNVYTGICPYWAGKDDANQDIVVTLQSGIVYVDDHASYEHEKVVPVDFSQKIEKCPTQAQLQTAAEKYVIDNKISEPDLSLNVSLIPIWQALGIKDIEGLEKVSLCDAVNVVYQPMGVSVQAQIVKTVYDVLKERYERIEIGNTKKTFTSSVGTEIEAISKRVDGIAKNQTVSDVKSGTATMGDSSIVSEGAFFLRKWGKVVTLTGSVKLATAGSSKLVATFGTEFKPSNASLRISCSMVGINGLQTSAYVQKSNCGIYVDAYETGRTLRICGSWVTD